MKGEDEAGIELRARTTSNNAKNKHGAVAGELGRSRSELDVDAIDMIDLDRGARLIHDTISPVFRGRSGLERFQAQEAGPQLNSREAVNTK